MAESIRARALSPALLLAALGCLPQSCWAISPAQRPFRNFSVAVYIPVQATRRIADPATLRRQFERIWSQLHFDEVYLEVYREGVFAHRKSLPQIISFFRRRGIRVIGSLALARTERAGRVVSFDWQKPHEVAESERAVRFAAHFFNTIFLDDFFFFNTRSNADIRAKGRRTWTAYRLARMRWVVTDVVLRAAREVNPAVRMIIKYPNWYENLQALGYDLDVEARDFDEIDTGDERNPVDTEQASQPYESYLLYRYLENIRPGRNRGGWVDTFGLRSVDGYAEQIWDTLFAKPPEITLFGWTSFASPAGVPPRDRGAWGRLRTGFDWDAMVRASAVQAGGHASPGWASVASYSLRQVDRFLGELGRPIGIASYKPFQSSGEDYLQDYLGDIGIPINLERRFPKDAPVALLTAESAQDPYLVREIKGNLRSGGDVIITAGLLHLLGHRGIESIAALSYAGTPVGVRRYGGFPGSGCLASPSGMTARRVLFPEIRFDINDSTPLVCGEAAGHDVPILLRTPYSQGELYVLNVPFNPGDYYELPEPVLNELRSYLLAKFPVRINAPARVSLFAYSNHAFIVESYRRGPTTVRIFTSGSGRRLEDLLTGKVLPASPLGAPRPVGDQQDGTSVLVRLAAHSYRVFMAIRQDRKGRTH